MRKIPGHPGRRPSPGNAGEDVLRRRRQHTYRVFPHLANVLVPHQHGPLQRGSADVLFDKQNAHVSG